MSQQTALGGGLWGNGLTPMEFVAGAVAEVDGHAPAESPEQSWACACWARPEVGRMRHLHQFAAAFDSPPEKGLCYALQGKPIRCLHVGERIATFETVAGMVGGGMDEITVT
jgi:hypothetical protein